MPEEIPFYQRFLIIIIYLLPFKLAIPLGYLLIYQYPFLELFLIITLPWFEITDSFPFAVGEIFIFSFLFLYIVQNEKRSNFLRFNTLNAILIGGINKLFEFVFNFLPVSLLGNFLLFVNIILLFYNSFKSLKGMPANIPFLDRIIDNLMKSHNNLIAT